MPAYFSPASFKFLRALARHNERAWFAAHRHQFEAHVRQPFLRLLGDLEPEIERISPHYRVDLRNVGGSLFRIQRDARFSHDKSPYKTWQGACVYHARRRELPTPAFYLHLQPAGSFVSVGLWNLTPADQRRVRQFILDNPEGWRNAAHRPAVKRRYQRGRGEQLARPPRGFPDDFEFLEDLRQRNFVLWREIDDATMTGLRLRQVLAADLKALAPFADYLCAALDLEF